MEQSSLLIVEKCGDPGSPITLGQRHNPETSARPNRKAGRRVTNASQVTCPCGCRCQAENRGTRQPQVRWAESCSSRWGLGSALQDSSLVLWGGSEILGKNSHLVRGIVP